MEADLELDSSSKLADIICSHLLNSYTIEEIMEMVARNRDKAIYVYVKRGKPDSVKLLVDSNGRHCYRCDDVLVIPVPKKFVLLEPDKLYFEMTLRANIFLAVRGAEERELHH